ncbi:MULTISPECIES: sugar phosphate isomerase/epimerase family protein [unclassified Caballeronia]|uniref:sugar phosphate isomerase/epimerase family protein n=1 Tax=unclassified Caballeronia TaxID=2646786 RepID=UPI0020295E34|nr:MULTISPECIES: sugar phosphate isomerase/epimerase [unclassified Caballeronia]
MQQLKVYQSLWAMERRRPDGHEWPLDEQLRMIRDAGFDGVGVRFFDYAYASRVTHTLKEYGMTWQAQCYPQTVDDLKPIIEHVQALGADHINLQPDVRPYSIEECIPLIEGWRRLAHDAGIAVHIETHRDRMTTDLLFTLRLLDCFPDLRLTGDISHYLVGREFAWPVSDDNHRLMHRILDNCWGFHGRVASREQIQVQISFAHHKEWLDLFLGWWEYGFRSWRKRAGSDAVLTFLCELGPKEYAMTDRNGYELSDRWEEAQLLKGLVADMWTRLEREEATPV